MQEDFVILCRNLAGGLSLFIFSLIACSRTEHSLDAGIAEVIESPPPFSYDGWSVYGIDSVFSFQMPGESVELKDEVFLVGPSTQIPIVTVARKYSFGGGWLMAEMIPLPDIVAADARLRSQAVDVLLEPHGKARGAGTRHGNTVTDSTGHRWRSLGFNSESGRRRVGMATIVSSYAVVMAADYEPSQLAVVNQFLASFASPLPSTQFWP